MRLILFLFLSPWVLLFSSTKDDRLALYNSLDPKSISENLSFYRLHPHTPEGKNALENAWSLLLNTSSDSQAPLDSLSLTQESLASLIDLSNPSTKISSLPLTIQDLALIEQIANSLKNRKLKGYKQLDMEYLLSLPPEQIDVSTALLLSLYPQKEQSLERQKYLAILDLMALQIRAQLPKDPKSEETINAINTLIFEKLNYRFPPHAEWIENIDIYTFLPSVMDSRKGVCLGISTLYICLAQRLGIKLEMITPPGHIFVRFNSSEKIINIETTARGIHIPSDEYLSLNTRYLPQRNEKQVVGLTFFNQASVHFQNGDYQKAIDAYKQAELFLPNDPLLKEFLGFAYILSGAREQGKQLLKESLETPSPYLVNPSTLAKDYLDGNVGPEGIQVLFKSVNNQRESLLEKKRELENIVEKYPSYREGYFQLAITWLQLGRKKEAIFNLQKYHALDKENPINEYYLSILYLQRYDLKKAWEHYLEVERIEKQAKHNPKTLMQLKKELLLRSPK